MNLPEILEKEALKIKEFLQEMNKPKDITNFVKTFEEACDILNIQPDFSNYEFESSIAHSKLIIIFKVLNEGWKSDWNNKNQRKYYPRFNMSPFGFVDTFCVTWGTYSFAGSRLCGKTDTIAEYAGRQFVDIYKEFYN